MKLMTLFGLGCVLALVPRAALAAGELGLSKDRLHWSADLTTPLFDPNFRWVPGDSETASFWVRNQSGEDALLEIAVLGSGADALMQTGDLSVTVKAADGSPASTSMVGRQLLLSSHPVNPGDEERIDVTVTFDRAATNQSQVKQLDLRFEVRLTQDPASIAPGEGDSDDDDDGNKENDEQRGDNLPGTGSSMRPAWLLLAVALVISGAGLARRARREEATDV